MKLLRLCVIACWIIGTIALAQTPPPVAPPTDSADAMALRKACGEGNLPQVQALIDRGVSVETVSGSFAETPLIVAAANGQSIVLDYLISKGAKVDFPGRDGSTPLVYACFKNKTGCALKLIDAGANVNFASNNGRTALMYAASNGNNEVVTALLAHHANLEASGQTSSPAVWWAAGHLHEDTLKLLAKAGADLNPKRVSAEDMKRTYTLFSMVAGDGDPELMDLFLAKGLDINLLDDDGCTPLFQAVQMRNSKNAAYLVEKGADINHQDNKGQTALMISTNTMPPSDLQYMMDHGAKLELKDKNQWTALLWASYYAYEPSVRVLVEHGADINATDAHGETPLTYAGDRGAMDIVQYLKDKGAKRTDVHVIAKDKPASPLSVAQTWALAVGAIYPQTNGDDPQVLGYGEAVRDAQKMLKKQWEITDKAGLLQAITEHQKSGARANMQSTGAPLAALSDADFAAKIASMSLDEANRLKALRASFIKWKDRSGLAWDLCRSANLVNVGFQIKYLNEQEAWDLLMAIARQTQSSFSSWQEMSDNFLDGRVIWAGGRDPRFEACSQLLLNPNDTNSPWNQNPWKTDLTASVSTTSTPSAPPTAN